MIDIKGVLLQWFKKFLIRLQTEIKVEKVSNRELAKELHKPIIIDKQI